MALMTFSVHFAFREENLFSFICVKNSKNIAFLIEHSNTYKQKAILPNRKYRLFYLFLHSFDWFMTFTNICFGSNQLSFHSLIELFSERWKHGSFQQMSLIPQTNKNRMFIKNVPLWLFSVAMGKNRKFQCACIMENKFSFT